MLEREALKKRKEKKRGQAGICPQCLKRTKWNAEKKAKKEEMKVRV